MIKQDPYDRDPLTTVVISIKEYKELLEARDILNALYRAGVDNWEWYDEAINSLDL